jgi:hypothetical protein
MIVGRGKEHRIWTRTCRAVGLHGFNPHRLVEERAGEDLAHEKQAERQLTELYPKDPDGATPPRVVGRIFLQQKN